MGLAASQARLLTITARKADCEFQSMTLSHQKIALARDMENISSQYQEALNTTKLVYDYYGSGTSDMDLSYDLLMTPSVYNDYYPKLVTDSKNRVMLNSQYAAAAKAAGIPAEGLSGTPSSDVRNRFIEALANENIISATTAVSIEGVTYSNTIGNGSTISATTATTDITYDELLDLIQIYSADSASTGVLMGVKSDTYESNKPQRFYMIDENGNLSHHWDSTSTATITLEDLLLGKNQYVLAYESRDGKSSYWPNYAAAELQNDLLDAEHSATGSQTSVVGWIDQAFASVLGGLAANDTALQYAYNAVYNLLYPSDDIQEAINLGRDEQQAALKGIGTQSKKAGTKNTNSFQECIVGESGDYLGVIYTQSRAKNGRRRKNDNSSIAINLNNIAKVYLTAYVDYMTSFENGYQYTVGSLKDNKLFNGDTSDFTFTIPVETEVDNNDSQLYANFYDSLFNRICLQGWVENDQVDDNEYLGEMFKNGMAYISSISDDGYYYQSTYSTDRAVLEVTDEEAIAKAEAKYNSEKVKLENKEDTIDLKLKNLDTEISSLTTEYDTTKSIITKAIEKSFKRYEA